MCFLMLWSCRYIQCTDLHGCNVSCCRYFLPTSKSTVQGYGLHSTCRWRWWDSTPDYLFPLWLMRYISVLRYLYMWLHFDIYIDVLCVPAYWSRDGTETQRLDRLRSGRYINSHTCLWKELAWHLLSYPPVAVASNWKLRDIKASF